jgi:hypothetical protein
MEIDKMFGVEMEVMTAGNINDEKVNEVKMINKLLVYDKMDKISVSSIRIHFLSIISHFYRNSLTLLTKNSPNSHPLLEMKDAELIAYFAKLFENIAGRSIEIFSMIIHLCSILGLDIYEGFKVILEEKAEFEEYDEEDMKNILREVLITQEVGALIHNDSKFRYYRDIQVEFLKKVHDVYGFKPSTSSMKKFLRELGFIDKRNKKVLKLGDTTALCLIYDAQIRKNLGLGY